MDNDLALGLDRREENHIPWDVYPRPMMKRDSFLNLNGEWDFEVSPYDYIPKKYTRKITVPYPVESKLFYYWILFNLFQNQNYIPPNIADPNSRTRR